MSAVIKQKTYFPLGKENGEMMKKVFFLLVVIILFGILITACGEKDGSYFGIVYDSCNLGQCVRVEKRWDSKFNFTIETGGKYCLVGQKGNTAFFAPEGFYWEKATSGSCYQISKY